MSTLLFYKEITILNRDKHRNMKLRLLSDLSFAAETHFVPLAGQEFYQAARDYPILFIGDGKELLPVALLGLESGRNLWLDEERKWKGASYVPAFVRRYPFVLADTGPNNSSVCFDAGFEGWNETEGQPLFTESGENTPFLNEVVQFLQSYAVEMKRTQAFVQRLNELKLLQSKNMRVTHASGEAFTINDFMAVDEEAFGRLDDAQILELHRAGFLGWIYAHLISLGSVNPLFDRYLAARGATAPEPRKGKRGKAN